MTGEQGGSRPQRVLLLGMMGAGKTAVGTALSARTGWPYRDNDRAVAEIAGVDTPTLLARDGLEALRAAESRALREALAHPTPLIAGVAGGVVERPDDVALLRAAPALVVYLHTPLDVLVARVGSGAGRPFLQPDPAGALRQLLAGREPVYRAVADLVVDTSRGDAAAHAERVLAALRP